MSELTKKAFIALSDFSESFACIVNVSDHTKYIYLNNQPRIARANLIVLNLDEYNQGLY